ncbi:MAG: M23 family metallopeptidase [Deltaproteobacteria bacterium]|nr:MAG: M23 family metallopeptidase [Deltaproteobacteria bacterium]
MRALPWILGGGAAAVAAYYWQRDRDASSKARSDGHTGSSTPPAHPGNAPSKGAAPSSGMTGTRPEPLPGRWVWPVGVWRDRKPEISDGFATQRRLPSGQLVTHGGVDIMYRRQPGDPWRAGTPNGTPGWVMPDHRAALAASDGVVWSAANTPRGWTVVIDHHPRTLATYYTHLSSLLVAAKQTVSAGTPLGIIGADPLDGQHIMHLHLEVWRDGASDRFDPQRLIETTWEYLPDPGDLPRTLVARNAGQLARDRSSDSVPVPFHDRPPPHR